MSALALALTILASACLYLISPNQRWLKEPLLPFPFLMAGLALLVMSLWLWTTVLRPLAGVCVALHVVMACLFVFPYIAALCPARKEEDR